MSEVVFSSRTWQLLHVLADGAFHSGSALAQQLKVSRATVSNDLRSSEPFGVQRVAGRGYRLTQPWLPLDATRITQDLGAMSTRLAVEILPQAGSSNTVLLSRSNAAHGSVVALEIQHAGKGRLGRVWHAGLGNALTFSLLWRFDCGLNALSGLSLAVGVAIARALQHCDVSGVQLKWPNDVICAQGKLGGVLLEAQGDMLGPVTVVIGIGINCTLPWSLEQRISQPASSINQLKPSLLDRNVILAAVLRELILGLDAFALKGLAASQDDWHCLHAYQNQAITLTLPDGSTVQGVAVGVNARGELGIQTATELRYFNAGDVGEIFS
jgi:BirA family transcriptional regulator, biotin operon repressor / biotin---[acetyl-CoA-carboxylase] ligase